MNTLKELEERANRGISRGISKLPFPPIFPVSIGIVLIFVLDLLISVGYSFWALYFIPIYITSWIDNKKSYLYFVTTICIAFTILDVILGIKSIMNYEIPLFNRLLGSFTLFAFSYLLSKRRDITNELLEEKKNAEELAGFNGKILESSPYGIAAYEETGQCTYVNEAFYNMIGAKREEALNQNFHEIQSWKESGLYNLALNAIKTHQIQAKEIFIKTTFNKELFVDSRIIPFRLKENDHLLIAFGDVTEARLAHQASLESEEKFSKAFKANPNALLLSRIEDGTIIEVNDTFLSLLGWTRGEVIGVSSYTIKMYADPLDRNEIVKQLKLNERIINFELKIKTKNKEEKNVLLSSELLKMSGGNIFLTILQDITRQKQIEEERERLLNEFERQQAWLNTIIDQMPSGLSIADTASSGKFTYHNDQAIRLLRHPMMPPEDFKGDSQYGALHEPDYPYKPEEYPIARALNGETVLGEEMLYRRGDGTLTYFSVNAAPVKDANGKIIAAISTFDDISEKKKMEEKLRESSERQANLSKHLLILQELTNWLSKAETSEELFRSAVELGRSKLGFDRMSIWFEGKDSNTIEGCFGTDELGMIRDERGIRNSFTTDTPIWHALTFKEPYALQTNIPLYDHLQNQVSFGERVIAGLWNGDNSFGFVSVDNLIHHIPFTEQQCEILGLYASILGYLIPRKYAEEALKASEERLLEAQKLAQMGNYTFDVVNDKIEWSDQMYKLWEIDRNKPVLSFTGLWNLIHPDDRDSVQKVVTQESKDNKICETEFRILFPDGRIKFVHLITKGVFDSKGNLIKRQGVEIDITERKVQQQKLEATLQELARSNKDLEHFAYTASHDLQEPIRMVKSYADLLSKRYKELLDNKAKDFLGFITEGSSRMQQLISDLLKYSRINTQAKPFEKIDANEILNEVLIDLRFVIKENDAVIRSERLPIISGDKTQIRQVFQNLIQNAIKFRKEKNPVVEITCEKKNRKWLFSIKDNGIGIEQEHIEKIFVIFQRLHEREKYPGTGIGLAIVKKIVERHGGQVCVESEPGQGSVFYFTLPE